MGPPPMVNCLQGVSPFSLRIEGKNKVLFFWPFQRKNALISTTTGFSAMENSMMTFIIYARPRRDAMHVHCDTKFLNPDSESGFRVRIQNICTKKYLRILQQVFIRII